MSNIFNFRPTKTESLDSDFLKDSDDTVEFDLTGREVQMGDMPQHFLREDLPNLVAKDWSNQELANIYRVKKLLDAAGVPNTLERGITDEGDPWCIFCTFSGDVFIHLCRIGNGYTLDSPNLRAPIFGVDFADLIAEFSAGALTKTPAASNSRVIQLQRNGKVFLHPSALLAALIWSIYINSEDLVMLAPEDGGANGLGEDDSIQLINEVALAPLSDSEATAVGHFMETPLLPDQIIGARVSETMALRMEESRDVSGKSAMLANAGPIAVGLSSIAIAFGIMSEISFAPPAADTDVALLDQLVIEETNTSREASHQDGGATERNSQFDLAAVLQAVFEHTPKPEMAPSALSTEIAADIDLSTLLSSILAPPSPADIAINTANSFHESSDVEEAPPVLFNEKSASAKKTAAVDEEATKTTRQDISIETADVTVSGLPDPVLDFTTVSDFTASLTDAFKTFDFGGVTIQATFDIASMAPTASDAGETLPKSETTTTDLLFPGLADPESTIDLATLSSNDASGQGFDEMDVNARTFIQHLMIMSRTGEVEVIQTGNELVLIDFDALSGAGQETYSMGWTLADGIRVYTIGLKADFVEFDLIA